MAFSAGTASLVTAILIGFLAAGHRSERGLWWFVFAGIAGAIGLFGFSYMEPPRPVAPRILCNVLLLVDQAALLIGFRLLLNRRAAPWRFVLGTSGVAGAAFAGVWALGDAFVARLWLYSFLSAALALGITWDLSGGTRTSVERSAGPRWVIALVFAGHSLYQFWRASTVTFGPGEPVANWVEPGLVHTSSMVEGVVMSGAIAWGVAVLHGQKLAAALYQLARLDPLTGLFNRTAFHESFELARKQASQSGRPFALGILDLDDFKEVNDEHGHVVGDDFLVRFAQAVRSDLRETDVLARLGGDEFLLLLGDVDRDRAVQVLERMRQKFPSLAVNGHVFQPRFSYGLATYPDDNTEFEALYTMADKQLYRRKPGAQLSSRKEPKGSDR